MKKEKAIFSRVLECLLSHFGIGLGSWHTFCESGSICYSIMMAWLMTDRHKIDGDNVS
jgi:hypothetical protein